MLTSTGDPNHSKLVTMCFWAQRMLDCSPGVPQSSFLSGLGPLSEIFGLLDQLGSIQPGLVETVVDSTINQESTRKWLKQPWKQLVVETTKNQLRFNSEIGRILFDSLKLTVVNFVEDAKKTLRTPQTWWPTSWLCQTTCGCMMNSMCRHLSQITGTTGGNRLRQP